GCSALFHPVNDRLELVLRLRTAAAAAVAHAGRHEVSVELLRLGVATAHEVGGGVVVHHAALRHDELVGPALPHHDLATGVPEGGEIRVLARHHGIDHAHGVLEER